MRAFVETATDLWKAEPISETPDSFLRLKDFFKMGYVPLHLTPTAIAPFPRGAL